MGIDLDQKQVRRNSEDWAITLSHDFSKPTIKAVNQITMNSLHLLISLISFSFTNVFFFLHTIQGRKQTQYRTVTTYQ